MLTLLRCLVILGNLVALAHTYTTFQTSCTAPSTSVNFVSSNTTRGTIDILWSCLFTIIACTWTVQHLNIPQQREARDKGWLGDIRWAVKRTFRSAKWMLATAVAPEVLILKSIGDLVAIKSGLERLGQMAAEDEVPWSRTHSLLANMGGFVIRCNVPERVGQSKETKSDATPSTKAGSPDIFANGQKLDIILQPGSGDPKPPSLSVELGSSSVNGQTKTVLSEYSNPYYLLASDLVALKEAGVLTRLPFITTAELNDKSKSDGLVRFLAIVQILWMIIQIIVRAPLNLAVSQLEIAVVAFAICAVFIYGLNWEKPKGVQTPYTVLQYHGAIPQAVLQILEERRQKDLLGGPPLATFFEIIMIVFTWDDSPPNLLPGSPVPNHLTVDALEEGSSSRRWWLQIVGFSLCGTVFGAIHAAAWNFAFPTLVERNFWRAASVVCTAVPFFTSLIIFVVARMDLERKNTTTLYAICGILLLVLFGLLWLLYLVARLFLLVEIFRTLFFLPPSAYVATWAANVPHIA